jgi:hypothetical protein
LTEAPSRSAILLARIAIALLFGLVVAGVAWRGVSVENLDRLWRDVLDRPGGPMTFRFVLQPTMAVIAALHDGVNDARLGRTSYFWSIVRGIEPRGARLWEGIISTAKIIILGVVMDSIYQYLVLKTFYPGETLVVAVLLAFVPYLLLRGPIERVACHWVARTESG